MGTRSSKFTRVSSLDETSRSRFSRKFSRHRRAKSDVPAAEQLLNSTTSARKPSGSQQNTAEQRKRNSELPDIPRDISYQTVTKALTKTKKKQVDSVCDYCGVYTGDENNSCKVCDLVYHKNCLNKLQVENAKGILCDDNALRVGQENWTCHICEDLPALLTVEEIRSLGAALEKFGMKKDITVTHANYLRYKRGVYSDTHGEDMSPNKMKSTMLHFEHMVRNNSEEIPWKQFYNNEAVTCIRRRSENKIIHLLKPKEIEELLIIFKSVDSKGQGEVGRMDAHVAFIKWLAKRKKITMKEKTRKSNGENQIEKETNSDNLSSKDTNENITWRDFVTQNTLSVIAARTNTTGFLLTDDYVHLATDYYHMSSEGKVDKT